MKANNNPGLYPVKGQKSGLFSRNRARNQFSSLSLSTTKTTPLCQMLVTHPAFYLSSYILRRDPQGMAQVLQTFEQHRLLRTCQRSRFLVPQLVQGPNRAPACAVVPSMSRYPIEPHYLPGTDITQRLWQCRTNGDVVLVA